MRLSKGKIRNNNLLKMKMEEDDFMELLLVVFLLVFIIRLGLWKDGLQVHLNHQEPQKLHKKLKMLMTLWTKKYPNLIYYCN